MIIVKARPLSDQMHFAGQMCITKQLAAWKKHSVAILSSGLYVLARLQHKADAQDCLSCILT